MRQITATELANATGEALLMASREPVGISRHGRVRFVLVDAESWRKLLEVQGNRRSLRMDDSEDLSEIEAIMGPDPRKEAYYGDEISHA